MISVCIPAFRDRFGLWATCASVLSVLESTSHDFEVIVVMNGAAPVDGWILHEHPKVKNFNCGPSIDSPQAARHYGFMQSSGEFVFFLDSHVVVPPLFFDVVLEEFERTGGDFIGVGHKFQKEQVYAAHLDFEDYLWAKVSVLVPPSRTAFKVAAHPAGAFAVRRESYEKWGGYWSALRGFGGEESQLCIKAWMMGFTCWATPRTFHFHFLPPGERHNASTFESYNFVHNFLLIAAAYGGQEQVLRSYEAMRRMHWGGRDLYPTLAAHIMDEPAVKAERETIRKTAKYKSIQELRAMFEFSGVLT